MSGLPEGLANGRSEPLGNDAQIWERPWTLEEMRRSSADWSLAADSGLFLFLQDFSQRMLSKTHDIEKQLDSLIRDTKATDSCLHSVFNDFLMLSNTQFIENRVYDEEVEETIPKTDALENQPDQVKTREQKEAELIPKMQEAVSHGLRVLESAFEHLDIKAGNSDSEDDEVTDRVDAILEPKDLYVDRPLPYLIGSQAFMEQEEVGLGDLSSDEMSVDSDRDSVIESEDGKESVRSDDDFNQEEDEGHKSIQKKSSMLSYEEEDDEEDEDSDIFAESDRDEDDDNDSTKNTGTSSFADELAARIKGEPVSKPEGDRTSLSSKKKSKGRKGPKPAKPQAADEDSDDMFKPPKMDDDDFSPFGGKGGLFSGGKGLFDDDEEGDLFSEAPKPPTSEDKKVLNESMRSTSQTPKSDISGKKIPAGGVSIFPDDSLFPSGLDSDSVTSKENGTRVPKTNAASTPAPAGAAFGEGAGGLFDDEDEEDDFFSGKSLIKSDSAGHKTPKKAIDLFDEDDGDIFGEKYIARTPAQSKKELVEEQVKPPEKKMPAGAISMFGPGTQSLLNESLKKCQPTPSEASEKSMENGPAPDHTKAAVKQTQKPQMRGLFSDDEDTQGSPIKSQSKPEPTSQGKTSKAPLSLFDDEEEEDLFASAAKSKAKPHQTKASTPQPSRAVSSSLFSDDEDQWVSSINSAGKSEVKAGGMKTSVSAPSGLIAAKISHKSSLFDNDDEDDLFAPATESSQRKPQRVALLFEDEGDDDADTGSLSGIKPALNTNTAASAAKASQSSSLLEESEEKPSAQKTPEPHPSAPSTDIGESKKKPAGGFSLFGGIDVLASRQTKTPLDEDGLLSEDDPPPNVKKEEKVKTNAVSLFDDEEEDESDWNEPIFTPSKPASSSTQKLAEDRPQTTSTGVFQDEELLFSQTQQKDNDPDVDLFAPSGKAESSKLSSEKPATTSLFAEDDEDDLFGSVKTKTPPPKVAEKPSRPDDRAPLASPEAATEIQKPAPNPVKPKDSSSRIGKLQANLMINPAALLPGAFPGTAPSSSSKVSNSSLSPGPATTPTGAQTDLEGGLNFNDAIQVTTLQSAHKSRAKGSVQRRPQSRAARQQAAQRALLDKGVAEGGDVPGPNPSLPALAFPPPDKSSQTQAGPILPSLAEPARPPASSPSPSPPSLSEVSTAPVPKLPVSTNGGKKDSSSTKVLPSPGEEDIFASDSLFGATSVTNTPSAKTTQPQASGGVGVKTDGDKSTLPSIFDANTGDLFQKVKPRSAKKKAVATSFLEEEDDDEDIFGVSNSSAHTSTGSKGIKSSSSFSKENIFQDEVSTVPKVLKKHKEKTLDASLFDDNIDIFADLTDTLIPKQKSKTKVETKSIFDDDMDDIFAPSIVKPVTKAPQKSKKTPLPQETSTAADPSNTFEDPLNALGGN